MTKHASHLQRVAIIPISAAAASEQGTGFTIPKNAVVLDVFLRVITPEATATTKTLDVGTKGTSNDPDGFLKGVSTATAGLVKGTLASGGQTKGALLTADEGGTGELVPEPSVAVDEDEVSWTPAEAQTEFVGEIIVQYLDLDDS